MALFLRFSIYYEIFFFAGYFPYFPNDGGDVLDFHIEIHPDIIGAIWVSPMHLQPQKPADLRTGQTGEDSSH